MTSPITELQGRDTSYVPKFDVEDAWRMGCFCRKWIIDRQLTPCTQWSPTMAVNISTATGHTLFQCVMGKDCTREDDDMIELMRKTVLQFDRSSGNVLYTYDKRDRTSNRRYHTAKGDYGICYGAVPIHVEGVAGVVAVLTITRQSDDSRHLLDLFGDVFRQSKSGWDIPEVDSEDSQT